MKKYAFLLSLKSLAVNVAADAAGGLLIGAATYNFAAAADLPLAGVYGKYGEFGKSVRER